MPGHRPRPRIPAQPMTMDARKSGHSFVPSIAQQGSQDAADHQRGRRCFLHLQEQVLVESHQDRRCQALSRPAPKPAMQIDEHDHEVAGDIAGQDTGQGSRSGSAKARRLEPGVKRRLKSHGLNAADSGTGLISAAAGIWSSTRPSSTAKAPQTPQWAGGVRSQEFKATIPGNTATSTTSGNTIADRGADGSKAAPAADDFAGTAGRQIDPDPRRLVLAPAASDRSGSICPDPPRRLSPLEIHARAHPSANRREHTIITRIAG